MTDSKEKYLINWRDGAENVERATVALIVAVTSSKAHQTAIFVAAEASALVVQGAADGLVAKGYEPMSGLIADFLDNGGLIWLCPACAKAKGITQEQLLAGVEIAGAPRTMAFLASGAKVLA